LDSFGRYYLCVDEKADFQRVIGLLIRRHRLARSITGRRLGELSGMSQSKVSKLESGSLLASEHDVVSISTALKLSPTEATNLMQRVRMARDHRTVQLPNEMVTWELIDTTQGTYLVEEERASSVDYFSPLLLSALLQEPEYAEKAIKGMASEVLDAEITQHLVLRSKRQAMLHDTSKCFRFLLTSASFSLFEPAVSLSMAQIERIRYWATRPNVEIGIVPNGLPIDDGVTAHFTVFNGKVAFVEMLHQELVISDSATVSRYSTKFEQLWQRRLHGHEMFELLRKLRSSVESSGSMIAI
jgi:transcriptional regulator with XRE-family HTH domain